MPATSGFEEGSTQAVPLEAHELLNAAGRAGRAGHVADGVVLVIPDDVVPYRAGAATQGGNWKRLRDLVFGKTDQCLAIDDPIDIILDLIATNADDAIVQYAVRRFPIDADGGDAQARRFLGRSLAAFRAARDNASPTYDRAVTAMLAYRTRLREQRVSAGWLDGLSVSSGMSITLLERLDKALHGGGPIPDRSVEDWVVWFFEWLGNAPALSTELFNCRSFCRKVMKEKIEDEESIDPHLGTVLVCMRKSVLLWMEGEPLNMIEVALGEEPHLVGSCDRARELVRKLPEISYGVGLLALVHRGKLEADGHPEAMPLTLAVVAACVREGHQSPESLAIRYVSRREMSRRSCRELRSTLGESVSSVAPTETLRETMSRVGRALRERQP